MGVAASEGSATQLPSLERLEKINSIYLQKGKIRPGYGLFIIDDRMVGVRASRWYLLTSIMHAPIVIASSLWGFLLLFLGLGLGFGVLIFVPVFLELVWAGLNLILVLPAMDRVLRGKDYSIDEVEERRTLRQEEAMSGRQRLDSPTVSPQEWWSSGCGMVVC